MEKKSVRKARTAPVKKALARISKAPASKDVKTVLDLAVPVFDMNGKEVEKFQLDKELFTGKVNKKVLYQAILMYNANQRAGTASTKTRGDVSGGGKKPFRQKGTGRARAGSTRSPLWPGGGIVFGPHPRDFHYDLPRKIKRLALLSCLNAKLAESKMLGISAVDLKEPKTKRFQAILDALKLNGRSLFVLDGINENIKRASRNIPNVFVKTYKDFGTMDVLRCDTVVLSKTALQKLPERFKA
jgi:large subunit ribosomal protein L4